MPTGHDDDALKGSEKLGIFLRAANVRPYEEVIVGGAVVSQGNDPAGDLIDPITGRKADGYVSGVGSVVDDVDKGSLDGGGFRE